MKYAEIAAQTRKNLMDAFWKLYCEKRIEKITVREITTKAGYNRGTFYEYFTDVYDVLAQLEDALLPSVEELPPFQDSNMKDALHVDAFIKLYAQSSAYYTVLLGENGDPAFAAKLKKGIKAKLLSQLVEKGLSPLETDYALEYSLSAIIGILTYWFQNRENLDRETLVSLMYRLSDSEQMQRMTSMLVQ